MCACVYCVYTLGTEAWLLPKVLVVGRKSFGDFVCFDRDSHAKLGKEF